MNQIPRWLKIFIVGQILVDLGFLFLLLLHQSNIDAIADLLFEQL